MLGFNMIAGTVLGLAAALASTRLLDALLYEVDALDPVVFVAMSMLCGASQSLEQLIVFRVFQGIGGGMLTPVGGAMLYHSYLTSEAAAYRAHAVATAGDALDALAAELGRVRTALLCLEANPAGCHRRVVAELLAERVPGLAVEDL